MSSWIAHPAQFGAWFVHVSYGNTSGWPAILTHGFPYSPTAYSQVGPDLASRGAWVICPYVRGYGPTAFRTEENGRKLVAVTADQAALGKDIIDLMDALGIPQAILGGFDWGGHASTIAAALWPDRVVGLVSYGCYDIADPAAQENGFDVTLERVMWYQHLFQTERGRKALENNKNGLAKILWQEWSPGWTTEFPSDIFSETCKAFDNPSWIDVVLHCYRSRFNNPVAPNDPTLRALEHKLAGMPDIIVNAVTADGMQDPLKPGGTGSKENMARFQARHEHWTLDCGHAWPYERPDEFVRGVIQVREWAKEAEATPCE